MDHLVGAKVLGVLGPRLPRRNLVVGLLTVGEGGYPNVCLLSPFQVVAVDERTILLAVYEGSKTSANLARRKRAALFLFLPPAAYYIKGNVSPASRSGKFTGALGGVLYRMKVKQVAKDYYKKAPIISGLTFEVDKVFSDYSRVYKRLLEEASELA